MSGDKFPCPHCSESITAADHFCPHCGKKVDEPGAAAAAPAALPPASSKAPMKTMVSFAPAQPPNPSAPAPAPAVVPAPSTASAAPKPKKKPAMKTMMGVSAADLQHIDAAVKDATAKVEAAAADAAASSPVASALPKPSAAASPASDPLAQTMPSSIPPPDANAPQPEIPKAPAKPNMGGGRTMIGGPAAGMALPTPVKKPVPAAAPAAGPGGGRTMLGGPGAAQPGGMPAAQPAAAPQPAPAQPQPQQAPPDDFEPTAPQGGGSKAGLLIAGVGLIAAAVAAVMLSREPIQVNASIVTIDTGEAILFEVPEAPVGAKLQFGEQNKLLKAGRATFPLADGALKLGENVVIAEVVKKGGDRTKVKLKLAVEYRIGVDTGPLEAGKAAVDVVISALPGTKVQLDGQPLKLDDEGRGVQSYPLDVAAGPDGVIDHKVKYRIQPPSGEAVVDELLTRITVTRLAIDSPGDALVTDAETVEIAGSVDEGTVVTIDGENVPVKAGRFLQTYPLAKEGVFEPKIAAQLAGRAPKHAQLRVERVADLAVAAEDFRPNPDLDYAKVSQNAATYKGQKAQFEGRVINVMVRGQKSVLQMLVRKCPSGWNCSLWVNFPAGTRVETDTWVRVLGTLDGEQQFRSESNEVVSVPKLKAAFVLPSKP